MLTLVAIFFSALAFLSGIAVVGSGRHFNYTIRDLFLGRDNALLYTWITGSTAFSLAHLTVLMDFGFHYHFGYKDASTPIWMAIHGAVGVLFVMAHAYIRSALNNHDQAPRYFWGAPASV
jgi:uncharacterized membrane protein YdcZ (DUF606 family)